MHPLPFPSLGLALQLRYEIPYPIWPAYLTYLGSRVHTFNLLVLLRIQGTVSADKPVGGGGGG